MVGPATAGELYLHVPFCVRKCAYCDFCSRATPREDPILDAYVEALSRQLDELRGTGLMAGMRTGYIGGGTPSMLGASRLSRLLLHVGGPGALTELTVEANPDSLTREVLDALATGGATRVSLGVQSLDDAELAGLGRLHTAERALEAIGEARASGLDVSVDLMCAIPRQTSRTWAATLSRVVGTGVDHVSVYPLTLEEGTPLFERYVDTDAPFLCEDVAADRMEQAAFALEAAGLRRYEVASYARAGHACAHNVGYWTRVPYVGLGPSAASMLDARAYESLRTAMVQLPETPEGVCRVRMSVTSTAGQIIADPRLSSLSLDLEFLDERQAWAEDLMLGMRLTAGVDESLFAGSGATLDDLVERGLVVRIRGRVAPTHDGWLLGNELYGALWDLAGSSVREASC
jgi:oxygen-independent coproporphyrinogen-3 oxidase